MLKPNTSNPATEKAKKGRTELRKELWPDEDKVWLGTREKGYFRAPRTLPLLLSLLKQKSISGRMNPSSVYLELLSRHIGEGIIEMNLEDDHAYCAGYQGTRATRSWRNRMKILEDAGFIKVRKKGNRTYGFVLLVHPETIVENLKSQGEIPDEWWAIYQERKRTTRGRL